MVLNKKIKSVILAAAVLITLLTGSVFQAYAAQTQRTGPTLVVFVNVINDDGGPLKASDFAVAVTAKDPSPAIFQGSATGTTVTMKNGQYNVSELAVKGYKVSYSPGCSGRMNNNEAKTCVVSNDDIAPHLKVIKHVINDDSGSSNASDFTIYIYGNNPIPSMFSGSEKGTDVKISPGYYGVNEYWNPAYETNYSQDCNGLIDLGDDKTCTVTNNDRPKAQLTVIKDVTNDNGGTAVSSDFTIYVNGNNPSPSIFQGSETGTNVTLFEGYYDVGENLRPDYAASYSGDCNGYIRPGETRTCTITNDDKAKAQLIVKKEVVGGTAAPSDFTILVEGDNAMPSMFTGSDTGTNVTLYAGSYNVYEPWWYPNPNYTASYSGCSGEIKGNEILTCVITNTYYE